MKGLAFNSMRVGHRYRLINYGETYEFTTILALTKDNFLLKDLHTLEEYELVNLHQFGKGSDFEIRELEQ